MIVAVTKRTILLAQNKSHIKMIDYDAQTQFCYLKLTEDDFYFIVEVNY